MKLLPVAVLGALSVVAAATAAQAAPAEPPPVVVTIREDGRIEPSVIAVGDGRQVAIQAEGGPVVDCAVEPRGEEANAKAPPPPAAKAGRLECGRHRRGRAEVLRLYGEKGAIGALDLDDPAAAPGFPLAWLVLLLGAAATALAVVQWRSACEAERARQDQAEVVAATVRELARRLEAATASLDGAFGAGATGAGDVSHPPSGRALAPGAGEVRAVLDAAEAWCRAIGQRPEGVDRLCVWLRQPRNLTDSAKALRQCREVARAAVSHADDARLSEPSAEAALGTLVTAAGLTLWRPQVGDPYDDDRHTMGGRDAAPTPQLRGRVSMVERRGLCDRSAVVLKPEVRIYD
jgi:hypothetical protein